VLWGATTSRSLPIRLLVGGLIIGASAVLTIEAVRYVNRKHSRWLDVTELEARNPKDERGHRKNKHHQWLTEDVGHPALAQHLYASLP
jgi:hypothetical protein